MLELYCTSCHDRQWIRTCFDSAWAEVRALASCLPTLHKLILGFSREDVAEYIRRHPDLIDAEDTFGRTALWWAIASNRDHYARLLIEAGADAGNVDKYGNSLLHALVGDTREAGHTCRRPCGIVDVVLKFQPDASSVGKLGESFLHVAAAWMKYCSHTGCKLMQYALRNGVSIDCKNDMGDTALHALLVQPLDDTEIVVGMRLLLDAGADREARDLLEQTPLLNAVQCCKPEAVAELLKRGASYLAKNLDDWTILHTAAFRPDFGVLCVLFEHGLTGLDISAKHHCVSLKHYTFLDKADELSS